MTKLVQAERVAELYGVTRTTVYRWVHREFFDPAPTTIATPSGTRDRILFDAGQVARQYRREMIRPTKRGSQLRETRSAALRKFLEGDE